jgi:hypothetical protein
MNALAHYCNALSERYEKEILEPLIVRLTGESWLNNPVLDVVALGIDSLGIPATTFISGFRSSYALYQKKFYYSEKGPGRAKLLPTTRDLEITLAVTSAHRSGL